MDYRLWSTDRSFNEFRKKIGIAFYFTVLFPMYILCTYYNYNNWIVGNPESTLTHVVISY